MVLREAIPRGPRLHTEKAVTEEEYQILEDLHMTKWPKAERRTCYRMKKYMVLYELAKEARDGCIVELGAWHGGGATALRFGTCAGHNVPVYTVDDHIKRGPFYGPHDKKRFFECIKTAGVKVTLISKAVEVACKDWEHPVALLFWDVGDTGLWRDFYSWKRHIVPGGVFAVHGDRVTGSSYLTVFTWGWIEGGKWKTPLFVR